ncbi:MAG: Rab family GTPase [Bacteroidota bacterium]
MDSSKWISKKIALLGSHAVGKTSLISQFVEQKFPESYLTTIGLKVDKKSVEVDDYTVDMVIWDIAGQDNLAQIPHYYINGCSGIIYVIDITRPSTFEDLGAKIEMIKGMAKDAEIIVTANKKDLLSAEELEATLANIEPRPQFATSAKFGENVEELFHSLAENMIKSHESQGA